jgi:hypothetical protein
MDLPQDISSWLEEEDPISDNLKYDISSSKLYSAIETHDQFNKYSPKTSIHINDCDDKLQIDSQTTSLPNQTTRSYNSFHANNNSHSYQIPHYMSIKPNLTYSVSISIHQLTPTVILQ